jgi:hypothetical protein
MDKKGSNSFVSKKLFITLLILIGSFYLKWGDDIKDWPFVVLVGGVVIFYFFIQGKIDLTKFKEFWSEHFRISMEDNPAGAEEKEEYK